MKAAHMKQKIVIPALVGMMMIPGSAVYAADQKAEVYPVLPAAGIETVVTDCYETKVKENLQLYLVPTGEGEYLNMAFSNTGEEFTYISRMRTVTGSENCIRIRQSEFSNIKKTG